MGEDPGATVSRAAVQVDYDVDFQFAQQLGDLKIAYGLNVDETVECGREPLAHYAPVARTQRNSGSLKTRPVMVFKAARDRVREHMVAEIRRAIGHADLVVGIALAAPQRVGRRHFSGPNPGQRKALRFRVGYRPMKRGRYYRPARLDLFADPARIGFAAAPVTCP